MDNEIIETEVVSENAPAIRQPVETQLAIPQQQSGELAEHVKHKTHNRVLNMRKYVPTKEEAAILSEPVPVGAVMKQDWGNTIYLPHTRYRDLFNRALGMGRWGTIPLLPPDQPFISTPMPDRKKRGGEIVTGEVQVTVHYAMIVTDDGEDKFVSDAWGSSIYHASNSAMNVGDALESAKSYCFARFGKDWGVYWHLWDKSFQAAWLRGDVKGQQSPYQDLASGPRSPAPRTPRAAPARKDTNTDIEADLKYAERNQDIQDEQPKAKDREWRDGTVKKIISPNKNNQPHRIIMIDDLSGKEFETKLFTKGNYSRRVEAAQIGLDLDTPVRYLLGKSDVYNDKKSWFLDGLEIDKDVLAHATSSNSDPEAPVHKDSTGDDELPF